MTDTDKLTLLMNMTGEDDTDVLVPCLEFAKEKIIAKAYPFGDGNESVPEKYDNLHLQLANYLYLRIGAAGETVHLENGISRHWEDGDVPATLLRQITPRAGVL